MSNSSFHLSLALQNFGSGNKIFWSVCIRKLHLNGGESGEGVKQELVKIVFIKSFVFLKVCEVKIAELKCVIVNSRLTV